MPLVASLGCVMDSTLSQLVSKHVQGGVRVACQCLFYPFYSIRERSKPTELRGPILRTEGVGFG